MNSPSRSMSSVNRSFSACEPSHQTILEGLGKHADSSTQLSSGVDTGPPRISRGERHSGNGLSSFGMVSQGAVTTENSRLRREELQGESRGEFFCTCTMLQFPS